MYKHLMMGKHALILMKEGLALMMKKQSNDMEQANRKTRNQLYALFFA